MPRPRRTAVRPRSLQKEVRDLTNGRDWGTGDRAKSGDTLEYRITCANPSAGSVSYSVTVD